MRFESLRKKPVRYAIGLMSGSSCDGIDAVLLRIKGSGPGLLIKLIRFATFPYSVTLRTRLLAPKQDAQEVCLLNFELGERLAEASGEMVKLARDEKCEVDFIASHGHTLAHFPPRGGGPIGTLQIGEPAIVAERTGLPVISNFRPHDMAAGGQGAPLVPYADWVLFNRSDRTVACLNIGGVANFTVVTPKADDVIAFDTGPGNMALDGAMRLLTAGSQEIDIDGAAAAKGVVVDEFLEYLLDHPFFRRVPPKSTGREEFGAEVYLREALHARKERSLEDLMATVTAAVSYSIIRAYNRFIQPRYECARVIVSGGGSLNKTLMDHLYKGLTNTTVRTSDDYGIPNKAREAIAFAILGNETVCDRSSNLPSATGARHPALLGNITLP